MSTFDRQSEKLSKRIIKKTIETINRLDAYCERLLYPLYLFPLKLITYSLYYLIRFSIKLVIALIKVAIDALIFPFRSLKNFIKALFVSVVAVYMLASLFVIADYLRTQYGRYGKFLCSVGIKHELQNKVVRIVGGYSEGTGFFISPDRVLTNFHVIADEPTPKIIFPSGLFLTPLKITGSREADLAILTTEGKYEEFVLKLPDRVELVEDEPLIAAGFPLGTGLAGKATLLKGRIIEFRSSRQNPVIYIQTDISLVKGMSGGPLTDQCGNVVGINTMSLAGLSLFISGDWAKESISGFTDQNITKISVDSSISPSEAVRAFYTYLKARRMTDGFNLLSREYLKKTDYKEWTSRFTDILDVQIYLSQPFEKSKDTVFVKFSTKNWINGEAEIHFYEGTWVTVKEDGVYKMLKSNIKEVANPAFDWFYE